MDPSVARSLAHSSHWHEREDDGRLVTEHLERVAAAVSPDVRAIAYLHEGSDTSYEKLRASGLTAVEAEALELLTRAPGESFELFVLRIAHAPGEAGRLARAVALADLDDALATHERRLGRPPYAWGARHLVVAMDRRGERVQRTTSAAVGHA